MRSYIKDYNDAWGDSEHKLEKLNSLYVKAHENGASWLEDLSQKANGSALTMKELEEANVSAVKSIQNIGIKKSIGNGIKGILTSSIKGLIGGVISYGISLAINKIDESIETHAEKLSRWKEDISNLGGSLEEYNSTKSSIDDEIERYKDLHNEINSGKLTVSEYREAKSDLLSIQENIINEYELEANSIDLVNQSLRENIELIEKAQSQEWTDWYANNVSEMESAKEFLADTYWWEDIKDGFRTTSFDNNSVSKELKELLTQYGLIDKETSDYFDTNFISLIGSAWNDISREDAYDNYSAIYNELKSGKYANSGTNTDGDDLVEWLMTALQNAMQVMDTEQIKSTRNYLDQIYRSAALNGQHKNEYQAAEGVIDDLVTKISSGVVDGHTLEQYTTALDDFNTKKSEMDAETIAAFENLFGSIDENTAKYYNEMSKALENYDQLASELKENGITSDQLSKGITDGLSKEALSQLDAMNQISEDFGFTIEDTSKYLLKLGVISESVFASIQKDLGSIKTTFNTFSEDITAINEMLAAGSTLSIENYEKLVAMGSEYVDTIELQGDKLVVNADRMNDLVDARIADQKAALKQSKAYSQLEYDRLSKEVRGLIANYSKLDNATEQVSGKFSMLDELSQTIDQYDLLAAALDEAGSAFNRYNEAKSQTAYGAKYDTASDAFKSLDAGFTSGKVGTKEFEAAVVAMVPEINREDIDSIYEYYFNELSKYFKYDDSGNLTREGLENFVQDALDQGGLFTEDSTLEDFTIDAGVKLQDFADQLGLTKEAVISMFGALEEYGYGKNFDYMDELIESAGDDYHALQQLTNELYKDRQKLMDEGKWTNADGSYTEEALTNIENTNAALAKEAETVDNLRDRFANYDDNVAEASQLTTKLSNALKEQSNYEVGSDQWNEYQTKVDEIRTKLADLKGLTETPTEFEVQLVVDDIDSEIAALNAQISGIETELSLHPSAELQGQLDYLVAQRDELLEEKEMVMKLDDSEVQDLMTDVQKVIDLCEDGTIFDIDTTKAIQKLRLLKDYAEDVRRIISNIDQQSGDYTNRESSGPDSENVSYYGTASASGTTTGVERRTLSNVLGGELGPELRVRNGKYEVIGANGPEFFDLKKGDIVFNHKQTEELLKKRKTSSRGLALAGGINNTGEARIRGSQNWKSGWMREWATILGDGSGSGSGSSAASDVEEAFEELIDEIEILLARIDTYISRLSTISSDLYQTYQNKNKVVDEQIAIQTDKLGILAKSYDRYMLEANKVNLSDYWKKMVQSGKVDLESIADEDLYNAIQDYQSLFEKAESCKDSILETHVALRELNNTKLENITSSFEQMIALQESYIAKQTAANTLTEVMGGDISEDSYRKMMETQSEVTNYLAGERDRLQKEFNQMITDGSMKKYTEDWFNWTQQISELEASIIDANVATREYVESIREVRWRSFEKTIEELDEIESELSSIESLIGSIETHSEDGSLTNAGKTLLGVHAQQLATAKQRTAEYNNAIEALKKELANGNISQKQYNEQIKEYSDAQRQAASDTKAAKDAIVDLIVNGIEKETEAYNKLVDAKVKDLQATRDYQDYAKSLSEKQDSINAIKAQIAALSGSEENKTAVKKLQNELLQLTDEYNELKKDHEYEMLVQGYEDQQTLFEENQQAEIDRLNNDLAYQSEAITNYLAGIQDNYTQVYDYLGLLNEVYGQSFSDNVIGSWDSATAAVQTYVDAVNKAQAQVDINTSAIPIPSVSSKDMPKVDESAVDKVLNTVTKQPSPTKGSSSGSSGSSSGSSNKGPKVSETTGYIQYGDTGSNVSLLQDALNKLGYNSGNVDGIFGDKTYAALTRFQSDKGIGVDGIVGPETRKKFKAAGFFDGGLVASALNRMVKVSGEDGIALVRNKEAILNPEQAKDFQTLVQNLKPINDMVSYLASKSPANIGGTQNSMIFHIDQHIDHIDTFSKDLSATLMEHTKKSAEYTVNLIKQQGRRLGYK